MFVHLVGNVVVVECRLAAVVVEGGMCLLVIVVVASEKYRLWIAVPCASVCIGLADYKAVFVQEVGVDVKEPVHSAVHIVLSVYKVVAAVEELASVTCL